MKTKQRYCVIGYPIKHSLSPRLHNKAFRRHNIAADYEACEVKPNQLAAFMRRFAQQFAGANVTIPHKEKMMRFLDRVSPEAKKIGAVNTIVNREGKLIGYNTDVVGAMEAIREASSESRNQGNKGKRFLASKRVIVLGAGGAARAVVYGLQRAGASVTILNRTLGHAKKLALEFKTAYGALDDFEKFIEKNGADFIINTTSVGMWPDTKDSPLSELKKFLKTADKKPALMDVVYRPRMTKLLRDAKKAGCRVITGDKMFFGQAAAAFKLWTGKNFR